jgi:glycoside/pentoside/hexuronide:cation symporter, GPH family
MLTYLGFSALSILHQAWGAKLGGDEAQRSRIVAWREGLGLIGVILASVMPVALGLPATTATFFAALLVAWLAWQQARAPLRVPATLPLAAERLDDLWKPFTRSAFRSLLAVFVVNGIASAVPATLILFFVQDRLQAPEGAESMFLGAYFLSAALAIPIWLRIVGCFGLARTWGVGMLLSIAVFLFAAQLGQGDSIAFAWVCGLSGVALGTDLALPAALLAGTIADSGDKGQLEGAYFGWWNFATKLNLALAAGVALPLLGVLGYVPGSRDAAALQTLTWAYCLLPCALKMLAAGLLYFLIIRKSP